jgi:Family of unknown function (DUF6868)
VEDDMNIETLQDFFFWCLIVNSAIYVFTAIAVLTFRDFICRMQGKWFALDEPTVLNSIYGYLAAYKLIITVFNFTPWIALLIIN